MFSNVHAAGSQDYQIVFFFYSAADNKAEITGETESESVYVMGLVSHIKDTNDEHRSQSEDTQLTNPRQLRGSTNG